MGPSQPKFGQNDTIALDYGIILISSIADRSLAWFG